MIVKLSLCVTSFVTSVTGFVTPYRVEDEMLPKHSMAKNQHSNNQSNETPNKQQSTITIKHPNSEAPALLSPLSVPGFPLPAPGIKPN
jgi:hypothetical protein